jgi:peptidyl-prolyl cis-trans isomerase D
MINPFKNFSKKKVGGLILIFVIIIAFGFGGFGGGFNTGNQNNIAKINNTKISTQSFIDYLNASGLSQNVIKDNIDKNIIEELLSALISTTLLDLEIKDLELIVSKDILIKKIKKNKRFLDENGKFQRLKYEKFLLTNNMNAPIYEEKLKNDILKKHLFTYVSGGTKYPKFLIEKYYREKNRKLNIHYINLDSSYKKISEFTNKEIQFFLDENSEKLKQDYIDFSYVVITPENLIGINDYNKDFFNKIDDLENDISKNIDFKTIVNDLGIKSITKKNYINLDNKETFENKIYELRNNKIDILEDDGSYILYNIENIDTKVPDLNDNEIKVQISKLLFQKKKYEFNKKIIDQIKDKKFNQSSFDMLGREKLQKNKINSVGDDTKFKSNSIKTLYSLPLNSFALIVDEKENFFIAKTISYEDENIDYSSKKFDNALNEASSQNRNILLKSYDYILNNKYKITINENTLDRVKNYFR